MNTSPITQYIKYKGSTGEIQIYKKKTGEIETRTAKGFEFYILNGCACVKGYSQKHEAGIHSNDVAHPGEQELDVRVGSESLGKGFWRDIKDSVKSKGAKYCQSYFGLYKGELSRFDVYGSGLGNLFNLSHPDKIQIAEIVSDKFGSVTFYRPVYEDVPFTKEDRDKGREFDSELNQWLHKRVNNQPTDLNQKNTKTHEEMDIDEVSSDDLPF